MLTLRLLISLKGHFVGKDENGHLYYQEGYLFSKPNRRPHRWVVYKGAPDPASIPAEWHGWLHFTHEAPLTDVPKWPWQKFKFKKPRSKKEALQAATQEGFALLKMRKKIPLPYVPWDPSS